MKNEPLIVERTFEAPIEKVWAAITDSEEMKKWYFDLPGFRAEAGYEFEFTGGPSPEKQYKHLCTVKEVVPMKKLSHSWRYDGYAGDSLVTWELFDEGGKTRVRLTHEGLETFPESNPDLACENFEAGWASIIGESLKEFVDGKSEPTAVAGG